MKTFEISTKQGLTNSQMYTRDKNNQITIDDILFDERFRHCLASEDPEISRADFTNLMTNIFTHYRNIRASKENVSFFDIGQEFKLK